jgi:hypothetical protein
MEKDMNWKAFIHMNIPMYSHAHTHDGEHAHEHCHEADTCHTHEGCNGCEGQPQGDRTAALLDYMLKHNEHHAAELDQVAEKLRQEGRGQAAEQIKKAVDEFQKGNLYLSLALSMVRDH